MVFIIVICHIRYCTHIVYLTFTPKTTYNEYCYKCIFELSCYCVGIIKTCTYVFIVCYVYLTNVLGYNWFTYTLWNRGTYSVLDIMIFKEYGVYGVGGST